MPATERLRVLIVQRQPVVGEGLVAALRSSPRIEFVSRVTSGEDAVRFAQAQPPHVVLCESTLPEGAASEVARYFRVRMPSTVVVYVSGQEDEDELFEAARVGAAAYLLGSTPAPTFVESVLRAANGELLVDDLVMQRPAVATRVLAQFRSHGDGAAGTAEGPAQKSSRLAGGAARLAPLFVPLSGREIEILDLVARGNSNKLIARRLGISDQTVKNHVTAILRKLEVNDRTEAVVFALRNGWIRIDAPLSR